MRKPPDYRGNRKFFQEENIPGIFCIRKQPAWIYPPCRLFCCYFIDLYIWVASDDKNSVQTGAVDKLFSPYLYYGKIEKSLQIKSQAEIWELWKIYTGWIKSTKTRPPQDVGLTKIWKLGLVFSRFGQWCEVFPYPSVINTEKLVCAGSHVDVVRLALSTFFIHKDVNGVVNGRTLD